MRTISAELQTELESTSPRIARSMKMTLKNGTVHAFTDAQFDIEIDGVVFKTAPGLGSVKLTSTANSEVSNQRMTMGWVDVPEAELRGGLADGAEIEGAWFSWFEPAWGKVIVFKGTLGEISWDENGFEADIVSNDKKLDRNIGYTYDSSCRHKLFSTPTPGSVGACMADPTAFTFTGTVASVVTPKWKFTISGDAAGKPDTFFSAGVITFTSGTNTGLSCTVKSHAGDSLSLLLPTAFTFPVGTTFVIQAGCDKTVDTCKNKFNNILHFGGFPHINSNVNGR